MIKMNNYPIVFPGVIKATNVVGNKLNDEGLRYRESRSSILHVIKQKIFNKIVIIDGSDIELFTTEELFDIRKSGILIEQFRFNQDFNQVRKYGKSNGECQLIEYAVMNSELINSSGGFYKLTPRYHFKNIDEIIKLLKQENIFYSYNFWPITIKSPFVMTIFYKTSLKFYQEVLKDAIKYCSIERSGYLEAVFYKLLESRIKIPMSSPFPYFNGIAGTTAAAIHNDKYSLRNLASNYKLLAASYY